MRLLVTGAAGMLGRRVVDVARGRGHDVTAIDLADLDLTRADDVRSFVERLAPDATINCAGYTDVDAAEADEEVALRVNRDAAANLARTVPYLVHLSTDYVFPGDGDRPYLESDPTGPRTAYGRTKLAGEDAVREAGAQHAVVRTAWLFGDGGSNFVDTILRLGADRDELRVVADQVGSPTWTGHLAPALVELAERRGSGTFHGVNAGACSWHALAVAAFVAVGLRTRIIAVTTEEFPRPAPRPPYSVLGTERGDALRLPTWQDGVAGHLNERIPA